MRRGVAFLVALSLCASSGGATAEGTAPSPAPVAITAVAITGQVEHPATYAIADLASHPTLEVDGAREGGATSQYTGTLLWPLLATAKLISGPDRGSRLQHVLLVRGADGYAVTLAIGELDPLFEGKQVIIATKQDGVALAALRLLVPGDKHAARNVRDLVSIEVR